MNKKVLLPSILFSFFIFQFNSIVAQPASDESTIVNCNPKVEWRYEVKKIGDTEFDVVLQAAIADGWHLYGTQEVPNQIPIPTTVTFEKSDSYTTVGELIESSKAEEKYDSTSAMKLFLFEKNATFTQRIKILEDGAVVKTKIYFMLCNDHVCMPPCNQLINVEVKK